MKKIRIKNIPLFIFICCLFTFGLGLIFATTVKANELRGSFDYYKEVYVDNDSYSLRINRDINILNTLVIEDFNTSINCYILYNNIIYDKISVDYTDARGTLIIYLLNGNNAETVILFEYQAFGEIITDFTGRLNLYNNINYSFIINPYINKIFIFENYILGHYTFNTELVGVYIPQYNFNEPTQDFKITGALTYPIDNYYLFNGFTSAINSEMLTIDFYTPRGEYNSFDIDITTFEEYDYLRYIYFDGQYIDNNLYEFLRLNGQFRYSLPESAYNYTFWDLVNSYVNIPVVMISSFLDVSIFNTGVTLLLIFSSILIIILAFKVGKMLAWM